MPTVQCHDCKEVVKLTKATIMRRGYTCPKCKDKPKVVADCRFCIDKHDPKEACDWGAVKLKILRMRDALEFYGNVLNYENYMNKPSNIDKDGGQQARDTLDNK